MNRKKFFITIVAICVVLIAAEAGIMLGLFRKGRKKDENKPGNNVTVTTEAPSPTEIEVTEAPKPAAQELFGGFVPTPTPEAWVDRLELYPGDRRIEGTEEGYRDVWRVTEQRFYTMKTVKMTPAGILFTQDCLWQWHCSQNLQHIFFLHLPCLFFILQRAAWNKK